MKPTFLGPQVWQENRVTSLKDHRLQRVLSQQPGKMQLFSAPRGDASCCGETTEPANSRTQEEDYATTAFVNVPLETTHTVVLMTNTRPLLAVVSCF